MIWRYEFSPWFGGYSLAKYTTNMNLTNYLEVWIQPMIWRYEYIPRFGGYSLDHQNKITLNIYFTMSVKNLHIDPLIRGNIFLRFVGVCNPPIWMEMIWYCLSSGPSCIAFPKSNGKLVEQELEATVGEIFVAQLLWKRIRCIALQRGGYRPYL